MVVQGKLRKISCQPPDFPLLSFPSLCFLPFQAGHSFMSHSSLAHHTLLSGKGTLVCHSNVVLTRGHLPRSLIPQRRITILVMSWGMSLIGNQGRPRCWWVRALFQRLRIIQVNGLFTYTLCSHSFHCPCAITMYFFFFFLPSLRPRIFGWNPFPTKAARIRNFFGALSLKTASVHGWGSGMTWLGPFRHNSPGMSNFQ